MLSVAYVGNVAHHQNDYRDTNLPPQSDLATLIQHPSLYNQLVPYSGFNSITLSENAENAHYNSLQVNLHAQAGKDLQLQFAYTLSKAIDPATGGGGSGDLVHVSNPYNRAYDIGPSGLDRTHVALVNFIYSVPLFNNSTNRVLKTTLGGWDFSGIITMESGLPLWVTLGGSQGSNGMANATNRPNVNGGVSYPQTGYRVVQSVRILRARARRVGQPREERHPRPRPGQLEPVTVQELRVQRARYGSPVPRRVL